MPAAPKRRARRAPAVVRPATRGDLPALARLGAKLARAHHAMDAARFFAPEEPIEEGYAWWLGKELANRRAVVLAAESAEGERRGSRMRLPRPSRGPQRTSAASPRVLVSRERGTGGRSFIAPPSKIVGYAYGRLEPRDWNTLRDRCGVAVDLWVEPEARGAGLGARLVEALVQALEAAGAERVVLNVAARNPRAQRLFARLGFRRTMIELTREAEHPPPAPRRRARGGEGALSASRERAQEVDARRGGAAARARSPARRPGARASRRA